jgi:hypothetical protein
MLCAALDLVPTADPVTPLPGLLRVGTLRSTISESKAVLLAVSPTAAHLVEQLVHAKSSTPGAMVIVTPTQAQWSSLSELAIDRDRVSMAALDEVLEWRDGRWQSSSGWRAIHPCGAAAPESEHLSVLRIDAERFQVCYGDKSCPLGNTIGFRAIRRLALRPGTYVSVSDLLDEAWGGAVRSDGVVQKAMTGLRKKLLKHGLHEITIDGTQSGHYALQISEKGKR